MFAYPEAMPRKRLIPDPQVLGLVRSLFATRGEKAVSFGSIGQAAGLAPSTLVQRYGSVEGMLAEAALDGWAGLMAATERAEAAAADKGPQGYLKLIDGAEVPLLLSLGARDARARDRAAEWRAAVEAGLARRVGQGEKARAAAQMLFATWQGQMLWGGTAAGIKDLAKKLG